VNKRDMIAQELQIAANYRREAKARAARYPALAAQLRAWADASVSRAEQMRCGPLFGTKE